MENEYDPRYQEGKIYQIKCNITGEVYIGSTIETLNERLSKHKQKTHTCMSRNIIDRGDYKIELIKNYPCNNKKELEREEGRYIRNNTCINIKIAGRTKKEHYEDNKEELNIKKAEDRKNNPEKYRQHDKNSYEKHKEKKIEKQKEDRKNNPEKYRQREQNRSETSKTKRKEKAKEKITCECGEIITRGAIFRHKKSMKHLKLTECLIID